MSQPLSGDLDVRVRVTSVQSVDDWSKAGIMIRSALTSGASHAFALASARRGYAFQRRRTSNGLSTHTAGGSGAAPVWLRLVRTGTLFVAYRSTSASGPWTEMGRDTISMPGSVYVGLAVSSHASGITAGASFTNFSVTGASGGSGTGTTLPSPWTSADIGSPTARGRASASNGVFTVAGAGDDVWYTNDQFHFAYQRVSGDTEIVARVASLTGPDSWSKAGVMVRESLNPNARHAFMLGSVGKGWAFVRRSATGGSTFYTAGPEGAAPGWVRLVREGSLFTAYHSSNGSTWTLVDTETIAMGATVYVGLAVVSMDSNVLSTGTFTNVTVGGSSGGNRPPSVSISSPANGTYYTAPATMSIAAAVSDTDGTVNRVDFYRGSTLIGSDTSSPFSVTWSNAQAGSYSLTAVATDNGGDTATSQAVSVTISGGSTNQPPSVTLTSPAQGSTFTAPASVTLTATATDSDGTIARVDFYRGSTLISSDTTRPYSATWSSAPAGNYSLTAVARDSAGATRTSSAVSIVVNSPTNQSPSVSLTSPSTGASVLAGANLTLAATASDPDGSVARVDFYRGTTLIGSDTTAPYSVTWTNVAAGSYSLTAVARDNIGATRTSAAVNITAIAGDSSRPTMLVFVPSPDHASGVSSYVVRIHRSSDPATATPVATRDIGKPAVLNGEIVVDVSTLVNPLPAGTYYAVVRASNGSGGTNSTPSANFTK